MGRVEKTLLSFLLLCVLVVGWLSWQSASRTRERSLAAQLSNATDRGALDTDAAGDAPPVDGVAPTHVRGEMVRSALPAPRRDVPSLRREIAGRARGTYIDYVLFNNDSTIVRWPERTNTAIAVWIQPSSSLAGWSADLGTSVRNAFDIWSSIQIPLRFNFVSDSASAELVVVWRDRFQGQQVGSTKRFRDQHGWLGRAEITLALQTFDGSAIEPRYLNAVAIHEVGHALGLDHSPNGLDIMAARNDGIFHPTSEDQATLALIYSVPPGSIRD